MEITEIRKEFEMKILQYDNLGRNIIESIKVLLKSAGVKVLSINYRIKEADSFMEKIERKSYENPLVDIEDICGIRIICYYQKDVKKITDILKKELTVFESQNKETALSYDQFGYRSHHVIASIGKDWEKTPNFRELENLKCEIQVRTVLMHAWAEIEHNLAYKNENQTPTQFRRKLHRISAKLEEADEQFEELKNESEQYQKTLIKEVKIIGKDHNSSIELNLDSLQAFMDSNFPKRRKSVLHTGKLLDQMIQYDITLNDLSKSWELVKPHFSKIEKDFWTGEKFSSWVQVGIARVTLDLTIEKFRNRFIENGKYRKEIESLIQKYLI